ncbi:hypothetical protein L915_13088 [Phytophthora nicotianae]|uniref:Uncharacterized protein n=1 Tax=Phytophthora nicotianae TaxID=4792 RepID=W2MY60_PHYNI|nr:hypothetical protein L915_13088 [Phytophthora nicotianae]ETM41332.1 hypothetical protein L914_12886 [Phytophthora nicotianae]
MVGYHNTIKVDLLSNMEELQNGKLPHYLESMFSKHFHNVVDNRQPFISVQFPEMVFPLELYGSPQLTVSQVM